MVIPKKHTLLVVDDEIDVCDSVHDLLRHDFKVLKARSAEEGEKIMREHEVHIIMTDQRMPKVSGVELLSEVRRGHPDAVRMLFTGYADVDSIIAAINQGHIYQFLKKPWRPEELIASVREAAAEYNRIIKEDEEVRRLREEVQQLRSRVSTLEDEVKNLRSSS